MISDLCKLVRVAFTPIHGHSANERHLRYERHVNRTNALLGQGSVPISRGFVMTAKDVRKMKSKVLAHDFRP